MITNQNAMTLTAVGYGAFANAGSGQKGSTPLSRTVSQSGRTSSVA